MIISLWMAQAFLHNDWITSFEGFGWRFVCFREAFLKMEYDSVKKVFSMWLYGYGLYKDETLHKAQQTTRQDEITANKVLEAFFSTYF